MYFINEEHKNNYEQFMQLYGLFPGKDVQYEASIYIASVPEIFECFENGAKKSSGSPLFQLMEWNEDDGQHVPSAPGLTGSTRRMLELGVSLYNGYQVSLDEIFGSVVSEHLFEACLQAIRIRANKSMFVPNELF